MIRCLLLALVLFAVVPPNATADIDPLESALLTRLRVHTRPDGAPVYVRHCRRAQEGCEARVHNYATWFRGAGDLHRVDPWLLAAIAVHETRLSPYAVGAVGERGVMQLHPRSRWGRDAARECRRLPRLCGRAVVHIAAALLARCLLRCGDEPEALGLYNTGRCQENRYGRRVLALRDTLRGTVPRGTLGT